MTTAQRGRPGPRRNLTDGAIVEAALQLLDRRGADAVSIRGIAAELGVAPNALYTYFPDKAAVLRAVADRLIGEYDLSALADPARPWRQRLHDLALSLRSRLLDHPGATAMLLGAPMDGPRALALGEALLALLVEAGLDERDSARASYLLIVYVLGSIALEAAEVEPTRPAPPEAQRVAARRAAFDAVPAEAYPLTAASADVMSRYITTEQFRWGLDRVVDGFAGPVGPAQE
ncbi:helix-turn-helix domain-containing protein [Streptomyces sp. NPDC047082]|uniref:TetR/AcrR family transcriptional regulator n=1 Tax=Streptomyces sp. NPDC047082 TaxID=3155259 RepID=UPI0033F38596